MKDQKLKRNKTILHFGLSFCILIFAFCIFAQRADAASLYFSPSSGSHAVGATFLVSVYVSSADQAINAASGVISFPADKLEIASLSKAGSVFSLWVQEPSFSNSFGVVNFEGIVLNPGFSGSSGKIITITFRAKAAGNAPLNFFSGSVLANDGKGTNILASLKGASFSLGITEPAAPEAETPPAVAGTPAAPKISSPTHPDPNKWYGVNDARFTWPLPSSITGVRLLVAKIPNAIPTITYFPPISSRELSDLADGIWYFHARLQNSVGWGGISRFRFQIDTEKPSYFEIQEIKREDLSDPKVRFGFDAKDETSGIDYYEVQIDEGGPQIWQDDESGIYETPTLGPGKHVLIAKAVDRAGNSLANSVEFEIQALELPVITDYPKQLPSGQPLIIRGTTQYPNAQVILWLQREKEDAKNYILESDKDGNFVFIADERPKDGIYKLWAEVVDKRGARSKTTEKVTFTVKQPSFLKIGTQAITIISIIVPLAALIILLLIIIWYSWHKFSLFRKRVRKETEEVEQKLHQAFGVLKEEIEKQVAKLDGKSDLSEKEKKICNNLKKALKISEESIGKEIKDIKKEIKK